MIRIYHTTTAILFALTIVSTASRALAADDQPNFIVFLTDDLGWGDLACFGHSKIQSPNLDHFATEGMRMTQCYSACAVCSPSRSSILTGRTPYRNGVWRWVPDGSQYHLRASEITIATLLNKRGYDTCHAGKWHLNGKFNSKEQPQPDDHGYDHWMATQNNASPNHLNPVNFVRNRKPVGRLEGPSSLLCVEEAISWLDSRKDSGNPFFLTVWTHEPHLPIESAEEFMKPYRDLDDPNLRQHHGNITQLDAAFGKLMKAVDDMGYRDETFVMFTSDNGPEGNGTSGRTRGSTGGLRGRKRHSHEGGVRVPGIVRWPGRIRPGVETDTPVIGSDIFTTICDVLDIPLPSDRTIDGASMLPLFEGKPIERDQPLYWRNHLAPEQYRVALRIDDWKIIGSDDLSRFELYNIREDWKESEDLSSKYPEKFAELKQRLIEQDAAVMAEGPDWWKNDVKRSRRKVKSVEPTGGKDETDEFEVVKGATARKSKFGFHLTAKQEGFVLRELDESRSGTLRLSGSYRSTQETGRTRNAAIVVGSAPTNAATLKIGTAIGMNDHTAFLGGWGNVNANGRKQAEFKPMDVFEFTIELNLKKHTGVASINGTTFRVSVPKDLTEIRFVGYYVNATESEFSEIELK